MCVNREKVAQWLEDIAVLYCRNSKEHLFFFKTLGRKSYRGPAVLELYDGWYCALIVHNCTVLYSVNATRHWNSLLAGLL